MNIIVGSLNIEGSLCKKLHHADVQKLINSTHIFAIQETWLLPGEQINFPNYNHFKSNRKPKKKAKRGSGGLAVLFKTELEKGITREKSRDEKHIIWIKCDAIFFGLQNDVYIAAAYYPPKYSTSNSHESNPQENDNIFKKLEQDIHKYSTRGNICIMGDFNSRIANLNENFIVNNPFPINEESDCDENIKEYTKKRNSEDLKKNSYGKLLLKLCNENKLLTLNGRKIGDTTGCFTCHRYNGSSVVDLCICDPHFYNSISSFKVLPHPWYSDHCPIVTTISTNKLNNLTNVWDTSKLTNAPDKYHWDEEGLKKYQNELNNNETKMKLTNLLIETDPDAVATNLESILTDIANKTLQKCKIKTTQTTNTTKCLDDKRCHDRTKSPTKSQKRLPKNAT